jgi:hypothetical protein
MTPKPVALLVATSAKSVWPSILPEALPPAIDSESRRQLPGDSSNPAGSVPDCVLLFLLPTLAMLKAVLQREPSTARKKPGPVVKPMKFTPMYLQRQSTLSEKIEKAIR